ncbi:MAG: TolC family protein [Fibrobacterota bacterium]
MKRFLVFFSIFLFLPINVIAETYTIDDLLKKGLKESEDIEMVRKELKKVNHQVKEAWGSALPKIDFSANYQRAFEQYNPYSSEDAGMGDFPSVTEVLQDSGVSPMSEPGAYIVGGSLDGIMAGFSDLMPEQKKNTLNYGLEIQQPVFAQGKVGLGLKIAREQRASIKAKLDEIENKTAAGIKKSFYEALLAEKNLEVTKKALEISKESHKNSLIRFRVGSGSELDTLLSKMALQKNSMSLLEAETGKTLAFESLASTCGITEEPADITLSGDFPESQRKEYDYSQVRERFLEGNNVLKQLLHGEKIQELLVSLSRSDHYPMVYCGASIGKISQYNKGDEIEWHDNQSVFAGLSMNIFKGFQIFQKTQQAKAGLESFESSRRKTLKKLELGLKSTYLNLGRMQENLEQAESLLKVAERGYEVAEKGYKAGSVTITDLQKAELEQKQANIALNAAKYGYYSAVIDLELFTGDAGKTINNSVEENK